MQQQNWDAEAMHQLALDFALELQPAMCTIRRSVSMSLQLKYNHAQEVTLTCKQCQKFACFCCFATVFAAVDRSCMRLQMVGDVFSALTAAVGAADKVVELIQRKPGNPPQGALQPADFVGKVELDRVAFSYPARPEVPVLNGLSLSINPGEVSLVTLVSMVPLGEPSVEPLFRAL